MRDAETLCHCAGVIFGLSRFALVGSSAQRSRFILIEAPNNKVMKIPAGTAAYIGPPAKPIPKHVSDAMGTALGEISEILEAHLPMVYIKGHIDPPTQVLVVVLDEKKPSPQARIVEMLRAVLPTDFHMEITELHRSDPKLPTIRATCTQLDLARNPN